jgi:DNA repair ATPase RecN
MENLLVKKVAAVREAKQAAIYKRQRQTCILTGLAGSSKPVFFAAVDSLLGEKGSLAFITSSREEIIKYITAYYDTFATFSQAKFI